MTNFWLIQRGIFKKDCSQSPEGLDSIVYLDYMGSPEFERGAIPKAYRRIMYHFNDYQLFHTGIYTPNRKELLVFCKKDCCDKIIGAIKEYVTNPYPIKTFSCLDKITTAKKSSWERKRCDFWWCIDQDKTYGNWMAFLEPCQTVFWENINWDFQNNWLKLSHQEREDAYKNSLND